jgi:kynureninase
VRHPHAGTLLTAPSGISGDGRQLDAADPLAPLAAEFHHPRDSAGRKLLYFCGHSLGLQPKSAARLVEQELEDWRRLGVEGHFRGARPWVRYHELLSPGLSRLAGALESEVVAMNSLTVNLHLMMASFFRPVGMRTRILIEQSSFPSDRYALISQLAYHGLDPSHLIEVGPREGESSLRTEDLIAAIEAGGESLALILLPGVQYLSGQALDLQAVASAGRRVGAVVGLDLAHAIGNTPLSLHDWNVDFAVWCSYKYLNAGPGAVGGCFVHERHGTEKSLPRLAGWWGHDKAARFRFEPDFKPIEGAQGWQVSNPPILSSAPLLASLELFDRAGMQALREKSLSLTGLLRAEIDKRLSADLQILTPQAPAHGCQLSLKLRASGEAPKHFAQRLESAGVVADWREPDVLRLAPVPLYNTHADVFAVVSALESALKP